MIGNCYINQGQHGFYSYLHSALFYNFSLLALKSLVLRVGFYCIKIHRGVFD